MKQPHRNTPPLSVGLFSGCWSPAIRMDLPLPWPSQTQLTENRWWTVLNWSSTRLDARGLNLPACIFA